jgi:hypothetical protein
MRELQAGCDQDLGTKDLLPASPGGRDGVCLQKAQTALTVNLELALAEVLAAQAPSAMHRQPPRSGGQGPAEWILMRNLAAIYQWYKPTILNYLAFLKMRVWIREKDVFHPRDAASAQMMMFHIAKRF